jgi:putative ABC transport system permease protein
MKLLKLKVPSAKNMAFEIDINDKVEFQDDVVSGVNYYGVSEEFFNIQTIEVTQGRELQPSDFDHSSNSILMGSGIAEKLFGNPAKAVGNIVKLKNSKPAIVSGIIKKQGKSIMQVWDYDNCIIMVTGFLKEMVEEKNANPKIIVQAKDHVPMEMLHDELAGAMRSLRKLKPTQDDNFSLNNIDEFSAFMGDIFGNVNKGGWAIAVLSLVVGMFGVANIMFVTVRERTSQIGLKKAIGAKRGTILTEFLLEAAFLCILGGMIGLLLVFVLTKIFTAILGFPIFISLNIMFTAIGICILVGVIAGIIPASIAARMDPVVAIRSK